MGGYKRFRDSSSDFNGIFNLKKKKGETHSLFGKKMN